MKKRNSILKVFIYLVLIVYVIGSITPFLWTILTSIKLPLDAFSRNLCRMLSASLHCLRY